MEGFMELPSKNCWAMVYWNSINNFGNSLNSGLDILVSNLMLTGLDMGLISIAKMISSVVVALDGVIHELSNRSG